jgi:hypothetical protein
MPSDLINFWQQCQLDKPPYFHPEDRSILWQKGGKFIDAEMPDFDTLIAKERFGPFDSKLNLSLLPVPYVGDLGRAEIVILSLNPGLEYTDYWAESKMPKLRKRLVDDLRQSLSGAVFPFWGLDPQFCWHSGFVYWEKKLRGVITKIAAKYFAKNYFKALHDLSTKLACLELIPYHSSSFGAHPLIKHLRSVEMVKKFVHETIVPEAKGGKRTLIVTRKVKEWGLQSGIRIAKNIAIYESKHAQGASLSPDSEGGKAILRHYGIETK